MRKRAFLQCYFNICFLNCYFDREPHVKRYTTEVDIFLCKQRCGKHNQCPTGMTCDYRVDTCVAKVTGKYYSTTF